MTSGTASSVADPLQQKIIEARDQAGLVHNYLDLAVDQNKRTAMNAATARLLAGAWTPEQVCQAITVAAATP